MSTVNRAELVAASPSVGAKHGEDAAAGTGPKPGETAAAEVEPKPGEAAAAGMGGKLQEILTLLEQSRSEGHRPLEPDASRLTQAALWGALGLAFMGILGGLVLCIILLLAGFRSQDVIMIRLLLSLVAVFVATAFGALGFALFLIKAEGALKARIENPGSEAKTLETTAPGLVVFICAVAIMYLALHMKFTESSGDPLATDEHAGVQGPNGPKKGPSATPASEKPATTDTPPLGGEMEKPW